LIGNLIGIAPDTMPISLPAFELYVNDMILSKLARSPATDTLLQMFTFENVDSPSHRLPRPLWRSSRHFVRKLVWLGAIGSLPPVLRTRLGVSWTKRDEKASKRLRMLVRSVDAHMPKRILHDKLAYSAGKNLDPSSHCANDGSSPR
jgi:uncharacterized protein (DUF2236 family)